MTAPTPDPRPTVPRHQSNFAFLRAQWPDLFAEAVRAERAAIGDPRTACFYARRCLELTLNWLFDADRTLQRPYKDDVHAMLHEPTLQRLVGRDIQTKMDIVRRQGNAAVHRTQPITPNEAVATVRELFHVGYWFARRYTRDQRQQPPSAARFDPDLIPRPASASARLKSQAETAKLADDLAKRDAELQAKRDAELQAERDRSKDLDTELEALRKEVAAAQAANATRPDDHDYDEAHTRDLFIDVLLTEAAWPLDQDRDREYPVTGMQSERSNGGSNTASNIGRGKVDYVLWGDDGLPLGLVEAKRTRRDATAGQQQAKLYADCLEAMTGQRPVIFYTNGYEHWIWDDTDYPPRQVQGFYTQDQLERLVQRRRTRKNLADVGVNSRIVERYYQQRAIRRISETFENDKQRAALVVMATGAGKTRTVIALVDLLMRAGWVKRTLFLADRTALVRQAVNAFKAHLPDSSPVNLVTDKAADGRVFVSTYPTMMGLIDASVGGGDGVERRFGPGYFDLVIIDEAHRSVYQKYGAIFDWFDSLLVGLTATPKDEVDRNTYRLFRLEDGVPTDAYSLDEAVNEGYLVPPRAVSVPLKYQREGIKYDALSEAEKDEWDALDWGEDGEIPDLVSAEALNRWLFNADTVDKVLATLMTRGHRVAGGDRLGKTIIFAKNNAHAQFIAERFDASYPELRGQFARVITHQTEYAQSLIDDFSAMDKAPHIAISVDMLDTGIDVPEVVNLVFFKLVRSKTKFWQMLGRGTRLRHDLYGPGQHKTDFLVFDFCQNLEFFNSDLTTTDGVLVPSLGQRLFTSRVGLVQALDESGSVTDGERTLRTELVADLHKVVQAIKVDNFVVRPKRRWVEKYAERTAWEPVTPESAAELVEHLAGLPTAVTDNDEQAKRFDLMLVRLQLARLTGDASEFERLREQVRLIAAALLEQTAIPAVREHQILLDEVAGDEWWVDVSLPMLEVCRRRLRGLVRLIDKARQTIVYTDFADELGEFAEVTLSGLTVGTDFERFRAKTRAYLRSHLDHIALQRVRRNRPLTKADLQQLQDLVIEADLGNRHDIDQAERTAHGFGLFVRSLVGLDGDAARQALSVFLDGRTLAANQIDFINLVVGHLTENGTMEAGRLYESPFTEVAPQGPDDLFESADVDTLVDVLDQVRANATVA